MGSALAMPASVLREAVYADGDFLRALLDYTGDDGRSHQTIIGVSNDAKTSQPDAGCATPDHNGGDYEVLLTLHEVFRSLANPKTAFRNRCVRQVPGLIRRAGKWGRTLAVKERR